MTQELCRRPEQVLLQFSDELYSLHVASLVMNILLAFVAIIGNVVVLVAISRTPSLHTPSYALLFSLAITDLGVGLIVQPPHIITTVWRMRIIKEISCGIVLCFFISTVAFLAASCLTMTAISIDRFLAIYLRVRYRVVVANASNCCSRRASLDLDRHCNCFNTIRLDERLSTCFQYCNGFHDPRYLYSYKLCFLYERSNPPSKSSTNTYPTRTTGFRGVSTTLQFQSWSLQAKCLQHAVCLRAVCCLLSSNDMFFYVFFVESGSFSGGHCVQRDCFANLFPELLCKPFLMLLQDEGPTSSCNEHLEHSTNSFDSTKQS